MAVYPLGPECIHSVAQYHYADLMGNPPHNRANLHTAKCRTAHNRLVANNGICERFDSVTKQAFFVNLCQRNNHCQSVVLSEMDTYLAHINKLQRILEAKKNGNCKDAWLSKQICAVCKASSIFVQVLCFGRIYARLCAQSYTLLTLCFYVIQTCSRAFAIESLCNDFHRRILILVVNLAVYHRIHVAKLQYQQCHYNSPLICWEKRPQWQGNSYTCWHSVESPLWLCISLSLPDGTVYVFLTNLFECDPCASFSLSTR